MTKRSPLLPIFLIVLVDVLGFTIVIPLLAFYAEEFGATPLVATSLVSVYAVCSLISTPIIGRLSDIYGRKPLLMYSQAGTCAGFLVLGMSSSLWMVFVGRILPGIAAGNLSIAQAYISDHTTPENRSKAFGVIGVAFGIGFLFGPALGGALSKYGHHVPFLVAAGLSATAMLATYLLLPSAGSLPKATVTAGADAGPGGRRPSLFDVRTYTDYFGRPALRALYIQFFLFSFAFSSFFSGFALFAERRLTYEGLPWGAREVAWLFTYAGFLGIVLQGGLLGRLVKRYGELKLSIAGFVTAIVAYAMFGFAYTLTVVILATTISSFGSGVLRPVLTSRITQVVGRHEQGVVIGISGSLSSVAMAMGPPTGGLLLNHGMTTAWALVPATASVLGLAATIAWIRITEPAKQPEPPSP